MNNLQVQLAQSQEALRQSELEGQKGRHSLADVKARCRHLHFELNQAQCARKDLATKLQINSARNAEMRTLIDVQEASKVNSERQVSESWRTIARLTEIIQGLRNHLDGHKLSQEERVIDVAGVLLENELLKSQVQDLKYSLADLQTTTEAVTRRLVSQLACSQDTVCSKDQRIAELERAFAQMRQNARRPSRLPQRMAAGV